jgi:ElaA protein
MTTQSPALPLPQFDWRWKAFDALESLEVYEMLKVRAEVFIIEQNCLYGDIDGLDAAAWHLFAWDTEAERPAIAGYLRVLLPDSSDPDVRIGRVLTTAGYRGIKLGNALLERAIHHIAEQWPCVPMRLHAQAHLQKFYGAFGFEPVSDIHDEDGIPHVWMRSE